MLMLTDADADAVTPSSITVKHQELHTSERTIVPRTVIFIEKAILKMAQLVQKHIHTGEFYISLILRLI